MTSKLILLAKFINLLTIINSIHDVGACENILSIYKEIGCKHVNVLANDSCTGNFECPDFNKFDEKKCFWDGTFYDIGEEVVVGLKSCEETCVCIGNSDEPSKFSCNRMFDCELDVGHDFDTENCLRQYKHVNGCFINHEDICGHENIAKLKKCYVQGRIYSENEKFSIEGHECHCSDNFDNMTLISQNPNCNKTSICGIESLSKMLNKIRKGCVPVFRKTITCPIEYKCPSNDEAIQPDTKSNLTITNDATCKFGNLILKRGEHLETQAKRIRERNPRYIYTECICNIPPFITCFKYN